MDNYISAAVGGGWLYIHEWRAPGFAAGVSLRPVGALLAAVAIRAVLGFGEFLCGVQLRQGRLGSWGPGR